MTLLFNKINFKKLKLKSKMNKWYINIIILNIDIEYIIRIIRINDLKLFFILVRFWQCYISNLSFRNIHYGMIFFLIWICICIKDFLFVSNFSICHEVWWKCTFFIDCIKNDFLNTKINYLAIF